MNTQILFATVLLFITINACRKSEDIIIEEGNSTYPDWTTETHSNQAEPNYEVVFNQMKVQRFDIKIDADKWTEMQTDLSDKIGSSGGGPGGPPSNITEDPSYFQSSVFYEGKEWYKVGVRYKGNSSLSSAYQMGIKKLSLKLDFDQFEDTYPLLKNQRFYGFKQLNLNNNYDDASLMREKVGADVFRDFGLAAAHTSFCVVYVDFGDGPQYFGVYALVEEVDDTVLDDQFSNGSGNLYKPDGDAAKFSSGTYDEGEMEKKTNEAANDYSDVLALYNAVNSSVRTSDTTLWKSNLEKVFNVDIYLKWLAANTTIQNWDTYGKMTHNYYLYNNPSNGLLTWIPWDNNEAFQVGKMGSALSLELTEVGSDWPLIRYIMNQKEYENKYKQYLGQFINDVFVPATMSSTYAQYADLIREYAYLEESGYTFLSSSAAFDQAISTLQTHVQTRNTAVLNYLQ